MLAGQMFAESRADFFVAQSLPAPDLRQALVDLAPEPIFVVDQRSIASRTNS